MIIISKAQAYSAFENACHLSTEDLLKLHSFQTIVQFFVTLKGNPFGNSQNRQDGLDEAALPIQTRSDYLAYYTGYVGHLNGEQALFDPDGEADFHTPPNDPLWELPSQAAQELLVSRILDHLRI